jgi:phospholipid/cholesterol/gamma-HCH transport system ATP-binding protein
VAALSGGERKRVSVARALVLDPPIALYDEPTSGLDPVRARAIDRLILDLKDQGMSAIVASHDVESIRLLADEVLLLMKSSQQDPGRIVVRGSLGTLMEHPLGAAFLAGESLE